MRKNILSFMLAVIIFMMGTISSFAAKDDIQITVNDEKIEAQAKVIEGELFLPLRSVSEKLGFSVQWISKKQEIKVSNSQKIMHISLSDGEINIKEHESFIGGQWQVIDGGKTYFKQSFFNDKFGLKVEWDKSKNEVKLQEVKENPVIIETKKEASETKTFKLALQYPEIKGLNDADVQKKLNSLFENLATNAKNKGQETEKVLSKEASHNVKAETYFNYQVKYNSNNILSIVFLDYQYTGGAHGSTLQTSYTFDLATGTEYELKDLFKEGSDYVSVINSEVKKGFVEMGMTELLSPFNSIKNDQSFYLSNNAVVVYFQEYEYLPYACGIPEFDMAYTLVGKLLDKKFTL